MNSNSLIAALVAALAAALGSLVVFAGPAQAYNEGDCNSAFTAPNIVDVDTIRWGSGPVDFGDGPHLFGSPLGDAVVCWNGDGRVAIKGRLFADSWNPLRVAYDITFVRSNGTTLTTQRLDFWGTDGDNREVSWTHPPTVNRVSIRLFDCGNPVSNGSCLRVATITKGRGD